MKPYRLLATLAAISACLLALPAQADLLTISGSASTPTETQSYGPLSDEHYVGDSVDIVYMSDYRAQATSWGNEEGVYGASASASTGAATAEFRRLISVTNNSTSALSYSLDFLVNGGGLDAFLALYLLDPPGYASASYNLSISRGATTLFSSAVSLDTNGVLTTSGTVLDAASLWGDPYYHSDIKQYAYSWQATYLNLDLGMLDQGESMDIHIDLVVSAFTNGCIFGTGCNVSASFSDPGSISGSPIAITSSPTSNNNNVPEPGTLSLLALGLTGFALRARKNRRRS